MCGKDVAHFSSLKEHMIHHTDDRYKPLLVTRVLLLTGSCRPEQCHLCRLTFKYKKTLVLASHTLSILYITLQI